MCRVAQWALSAWRNNPPPILRSTANTGLLNWVPRWIQDGPPHTVSSFLTEIPISLKIAQHAHPRMPHWAFRRGQIIAVGKPHNDGVLFGHTLSCSTSAAVSQDPRHRHLPLLLKSEPALLQVLEVLEVLAIPCSGVGQSSSYMRCWWSFSLRYS